jgi:iron complex transport system substrate-binding protein
MKFIYAFIAVVLISVLSLAGCQSVTPAASSPASITVTDDIGRNVRILGTPQRIISLSPSNTEIVYALGLEDRLIGVTTYDNYPEAAKSKPQVSGYSEVDVEKTVALQPDLILADDIHKTEVVPALEKLGIPVLVLASSNIDGLLKNLGMAGKITGKTREADALVADLQQRIKAITDKVGQLKAEKTRILYVTWHDPLWTAGRNTMIDDLIHRVGASNIAGDLDGYATISLESAIEKNPQIIIVMSSMGDQNASFDYLNQEPRFQATDALKNKRVYKIDSDIFGRTTPRIVDGLETLAKMAHPEAFK